MVYNFIYRQKAVLEYNLFVKFKLQTKAEKLITNLTYNNLIANTKEIKKTNKYTNLAILVFKW